MPFALRASFLPLLCLSSSLLACAPTPEDLLVGLWQSNSAEGRKGRAEWMPHDLECRRDDRREYLSDGTWNQYLGSELCQDQRTNDIGSGTWRMIGEGASIMEASDGFVGEYESVIEALDETNLALRFATGVVATSSHPDEVRWNWKRIK